MAMIFAALIIVGGMTAKVLYDAGECVVVVVSGQVSASAFEELGA